MSVAGTQSRPPEEAQRLWLRALELADPRDRADHFAGVNDVLSAAQHDSTTLAHALALGRTRLGREAKDRSRVDRAVRTLARAVRFLGVRPEAHAAAGSGVSHGA